LSVTVNVTVYVPGEYVWLAVAPGWAGLPSPKLHEYDTTDPS
jgi:hypothetical protein